MVMSGFAKAPAELALAVIRAIALAAIKVCSKGADTIRGRVLLCLDRD